MPPRRRKLRYRGLPPVLRAISLALILATALYFFSQSSVFAINKVEVQGNRMVAEEEVKGLAAIPTGFNLWRLNERLTGQRIASHPLVKSVRVSRRMPGTIRIFVEERKALALLPVPDGFLVLDETGVYMDKTSKITGFNLPVVSGVRLGPLPARGAVLEAAGLPEALEVARQLPEELRQAVSEIRVAGPGELTLFLVGGVEARLGAPERLAEKMDLLAQIKESLSRQGKWADLGYVDLSYKGYPVIR